MKRPRPTIRGMMALTAAVALAFWAVNTGWPAARRWDRYRRRAAGWKVEAEWHRRQAESIDARWAKFIRTGELRFAPEWSKRCSYSELVSTMEFETGLALDRREMADKEAAYSKRFRDAMFDPWVEHPDLINPPQGWRF